MASVSQAVAPKKSARVILLSAGWFAICIATGMLSRTKLGLACTVALLAIVTLSIFSGRFWMQTPSLVRRLSDLCFSHPIVSVLGWIAVAVGLLIGRDLAKFDAMTPAEHLAAIRSSGADENQARRHLLAIPYDAAERQEARGLIEQFTARPSDTQTGVKPKLTREADYITRIASKIANTANLKRTERGKHYDYYNFLDSSGAEGTIAKHRKNPSAWHVHFQPPADSSPENFAPPHGIQKICTRYSYYSTYEITLGPLKGAYFDWLSQPNGLKTVAMGTLDAAVMGDPPAIKNCLAERGIVHPAAAD